MGQTRRTSLKSIDVSRKTFIFLVIQGDLMKVVASYCLCQIPLLRSKVCLLPPALRWRVLSEDVILESSQSIVITEAGKADL